MTEVHSKDELPLLMRTYSKEEILARERYVKIENSDVPANNVDIASAVERAIEKMREQVRSSPKPK